MMSLFEQRGFALLLCFGLFCFTTGCGDDGEVRSYSVENADVVQAGNHEEANDAPAAPETPSSPDATTPPAATENPHAAPTANATAKPARMFAAMIVRGDKTWYYKMTGPVEDVEAASKTLAEFIASVKYEGDKATWTLPKDWKTGTGNSIRYATLMVPSKNAPLEFAISQFKTGGSDELMFAAAIINRWRGQLGLKSITSKEIGEAGEDITKETSKQKVGDQTIYFVNIVGKQSNGGMRPPFAR